MNYNATRNVGGLKKAKRVSDVGALGAPSPPPPYSPGPGFTPGYQPTPQAAQPQFQEGISLDNTPNFGSQVPPNNANYNFMPGFPAGMIPPGTSPAQFGAVLQQPIVQDMAMQYGQQLAAQGREMAQRKLQAYVPVTKLRYYFAVDTRYVIKKLMLIFFPFTHKDWMVKYDQDSPVQPRYDLNAPDLYIPAMGYITYILLAGFMLGLQQRFTPEQIGMISSSALAYIIFEMLIYLMTLYITNTSTNLKTLDLLAFSGYKYTIMIASVLVGCVLSRTGYYAVLFYASCTLSYFLVKTLRVQVLAGSQVKEPPSYGYTNPYMDAPQSATGGTGGSGGTKRRVYFLLFVAITQPILSWWLTYHLVPSEPIPLPIPLAV